MVYFVTQKKHLTV